MLRVRAVLLVGLFALVVCLPQAFAEFRVTFSPSVRNGPFTGRLYLFFSGNAPEPRTGPNWFNPEPFLSRDVSEWSAGEVCVLSLESRSVLTFPRDLSAIELHGQRVQAVARFNPLTPRVGDGAGNGYSEVAVVRGDGEPVTLTISRLVPERPFEETAWTKQLRVRSQLLSEFHGRDVFVQGAVVLPASYQDHPQRRFPTIFIVPGFSGTHHDGRRSTPIAEQNAQGVEFLRVTLDPSCPLGHHVFADSANNGPVGQSLVTEFLPEFDRQFRSIAQPGARFLSGHSSGGWSTLWLQITYPHMFGGVWSTAPDPVDFRDFQRINLYRPGENMYVDREGRRRPITRPRGETVLWYDEFDWMEHVLGPGGQLHSFEAAFSPRGPDGRPKRLWDRRSGVIDTELARSWERYDLRLQLERRWDVLSPQLTGKLHVFIGTEDTFLLEGATRLLKESLEMCGSDAVIELHAGRDHSDLLTPELRSRIRAEMVATFLEKFPDWPDDRPVN